MKLSDYFFSAGNEIATFENFVPAPYLRYKFNVDYIRSAELTISALGFYELFINGKRITKGRLSPYISNPDHLIYYDTYDLTEYLNDGENIIALILGNGMQNCIGGEIWDFTEAPFRSAPKFALDFTYTDKNGIHTENGENFIFAHSPIIFNDLRAGEWYDAQKELDGWQYPDFDDSSWEKVIPASTPKGEKRICEVTPMISSYELKPVSIHRGGISIPPVVDSRLKNIPPLNDEMGEGWIFDFGANILGNCRIHIKNAKKGQKLIIQYAEILGDNPDGLDNTTVRDENSGLDLRGFHFLPERFNHRDVYICKGSEEIWEPSFTCHGFRYALVLGLGDEKPSTDLLTAVVINADFTKRAEFSCSDDMVNRLFEAGIRTNLGNFSHFPTDCPHREKNGWTGDASLSAEHMLMTLSCENNLKEWMRNIKASMREDGSLPGIVPTSGWGYGFGPVWDSVFVEIPYQIWRLRGDISVAEENADAIFKWLKFTASLRNSQGLLEDGLGDWCQTARKEVNEPSAPPIFTSTVYTMSISEKAAVLFKELKLTEYASFAENLSAELKSAARKHLLDLNNFRTKYYCQTAQAMAIYYGLFNPVEAKEAFKVLLKLIDLSGGHIDCGSLGLRVIFHTLSRYGRSDLALSMITRTDFPSYGYWIKHGATTFWELFNPIECVQSSCNHHFFGDIINWFMQNLAGIRHNPYNDDCNYTLISPHFLSGMNFAKGKLLTPSGEVKCEWERIENGEIKLKTSIPNGMRAELVLDDWQLENGRTCIELSGENEYILSPVSYHNSLRCYSKN